MTELMMYMMTEESFVRDLFGRITAYNNAVIKTAAAMGVDCVHFGDDWGTQQGLMISPDLWRALVRPFFKDSCDTAKQAGLLVSLHSCGNVAELIPDMIDCGVDVFDPFQPEAMDIWSIREEYRGRIAFWGGLSVQKTMPYGTPEDVSAETEKLIAEMAPGGGYILSPSHSLSGDVPAENIRAFLDTARGRQQRL
jgi:uroporphyrinogen decarboxylase